MGKSGTIGLIGIGAAGAALAVELSLRGLDDFLVYDRNPLIQKALLENDGIRYAGLCGTGTVRGLRSADSLREVVNNAEYLIVSVTSDCHFKLAREISPMLRPQQLVVLHTGYVAGCRVFLSGLQAEGCTRPPFLAEAINTLHLAGSSAPGEVYIRGRKRWLEITGLTPDATEKTLSSLASLMPELAAGRTTLETGLNNPNPIGHVPALVGNLGLLDRDLGDVTKGALQFDELRSEAIQSLCEAVERERVAVMRSLGLNPMPIQSFLERAYRPGDRLVDGVPRFGTKLLPRFLTEDVATAFVPIESLASWQGMSTPVISALITVCATVSQVDYRLSGRTVGSIGIDWIESECRRVKA